MVKKLDNANDFHMKMFKLGENRIESMDISNQTCEYRKIDFDSRV